MNLGRHRRLRGGAVALLLGLAAWPTTAPASHSVLVYAAASMTNAVEEIVDSCERGHPKPIRMSFAASSVLAKQIDHGASAAVFLSANPAWMDYLERRDLLAAGSRQHFAGNALVIVAPASSPSPASGRLADVLAALPADARIAMGDPDHVPAGLYARAALESLGAWAAVRGRVARAANVRAALALVESGAAPLGIVYATDAEASRRVHIVAELPRESHPPIVYESAIIRGRDTPAVRRLFACMQEAETAAILARHGFRTRDGERHADTGHGDTGHADTD